MDKDRVSLLETEVRALKASSSEDGAGGTTKAGTSSKGKCQTCTTGSVLWQRWTVLHAKTQTHEKFATVELISLYLL